MKLQVGSYSTIEFSSLLLDLLQLLVQQSAKTRAQPTEKPHSCGEWTTTTKRVPIGASQTLQEEAPTVTPALPTQQETIILVLRPRKKVSWDAGTVDNENMQKKSSKMCCVFHKKQMADDSSDEDDDCCGSEGRGKGHHHHCDEEDDCGDDGKGKAHHHHYLHHQSGEVAEFSGKSNE
ncbi:unnamed protein product [Calypogeia fissa]